MGKNRFHIELPVTDVLELVATLGLEHAWQTLALTHAVNTSGTQAWCTLPEFKGVGLQPHDLLAGLTFGERSLLYEMTLARVSSGSRKAAGQFFTPDDAATFVAQQAKQFPNGVWLDPCSGVGNLSYALLKEQPNPQTFLTNNLICADKDPLAVFLARVYLHVEFGDHNTFANATDKFLERDFLSDPIPTHDYVIANPPYARTPKDDRFDSADCGDLYGYFMERAVTSSQGGVLVTPGSFLVANRFKTLREFLLKQVNGLDLICFDNMPAAFFNGPKFDGAGANNRNSTRAVVSVFGTENGWRSTPLLRWPTAERTKLLESAVSYLSPITGTADCFPKVHGFLRPLYERMTDWPVLRDFVSTEPTDYMLRVPASPRYFLSVASWPLDRTSYVDLFFETAEQRDWFFVYLNSSITYWWWLVRDGGLLLSAETLLGLPVLPVGERPDGELVTELGAELLAAERDCLLSTLNGGKTVENVKHGSDLVGRVNGLFFPEFATGLNATHSNSVFEWPK